MFGADVESPSSLTDVAVVVSAYAQFTSEREAFLRVTAPDDELEEGLLRI